MFGQRVLLTDFAWSDVDIERHILEEAGIELIVAPDTREDTLVELATDADAIMTCWAPVTRRVIQAANRCRLIARLGIGLDNIDVAEATRRGILVTNVPDYCLVEVAEHTLALLLALARKVAFYHHQTKEGIYDIRAGVPLRRLEGQRLGLVGLGRIAQQVARRAAGLGLELLGTSRTPNKRVPGVRWCSLDELLSASDFVSLHVPLTDETRHLIGARQLAQMKSGAYLINTARGGLVDHAALAEALARGHLHGAALDVQDPEPPPLDQPPFNDPRVIVTPHVAFMSETSVADLRRRVATQVVVALKGGRPENIVNSEVLDTPS